MAGPLPTTDPRIGDILATERRRRLVGRQEQVAAFRTVLAGGGPTVFYVHGPGGIGKSSLLDLYAEEAAASAMSTRRLDCRRVRPTPRSVLDAVGDLGGAPDHVLMLDGVEHWSGLDEWLRADLLPRLPASSITVLAGRNPPGPGWRSDPAWRDVLVLVPLQNLDQKACQEYLLQSGVDPVLHARMVEVTHGHPLTLSLLTDVVARGGAISPEPLGPDLVGTLLHQLLDVVPATAQRRALGVCALARTTSEPLLRAALGTGDAHPAFEWLRGISFIEQTEWGLVPHDLARDALDADLRWRDRDTYAATFRRIAEYLIAKMKSTQGIEQFETILDAKFMHRHQRISQVWADWETFGQHHPEAATAADRDVIVGIVERWEGDQSAAIAEHWLDRQPGGFAVVRDPDGVVRGVLGLIDLTAASPEDLDTDPCAAAAWEHARRRGAPTPGQRVTQSRFIIDREAYQGPSPTLNLAPALTIQHFLRTPGLCRSFIVVDDPDRWQEYFSFFEIPRVKNASIEIGGRRFGLFERDFRRIPLDPWLRLMFERDLVGDGAVTPGTPAPPVMVLSRDDFDDAVRCALRDLHRSDRLATNPLLSARLVLARNGEAPPSETLRALLVAAIERLRQDAREEKLYRVLDRTYLRPAPTQEKAADVLSLPLSTYKRHLRAAIERVTAELWELELAPD